MKKIFKLVGVLALICTVCTAILAAVNAVTEKPIELAKELNVLEAAKKVLPAGSEPVKVAREIEGQSVDLFVARDAVGKMTAVAVQGTSNKGYGGPVTLMVGIAAEGTLISYEVTGQTETPGLGTKIKDASGTFGKSLLTRPDGTPRPVAGTVWKVKRDGGEIDAVTAATISSRAALEAVRNAIATYEAVKADL